MPGSSRAAAADAPPAAMPPSRRARLAGFLLVVALLAAWQGLSAAGWLNPHALPAPSRVAGAWLDLARTSLPVDALASVLRVTAGFTLAALLGVGLGVALGLAPRLQRPVRLLTDLLRPIPPIAWIPLAVLWFGIGDRSAVFIVVLGAFFPIFLSTADGVRRVPRAHVDCARSLGAGRGLIFRDVVFPAALPEIGTGLRIGMGMAWMSVIAAELVGARSGLGYLIQLNRLLLNTERVMAGMITIGILGYAMNHAARRLERRLTPWVRG